MYDILTNVPTCHREEIIGHSSENCNINFSFVNFFVFAIVLIFSFTSGFRFSLHTSLSTALNSIPLLHIISVSPIFSAPSPDFVQVCLSSYIDL